ncbi:gp53-like domain-containing protein [Enterobacter asburiae]|uniref:gp53-like domain-containing protein n=1 Tax=Enterobacter asburiae TaxID=61645 RepID=UPI002649D651|nr:hypothetical protein [Enterobacter asburiae]WKE06048.1 hypothetical protein QOM25_11775 [Enterobacter asburiae]WKE08111.1 hypothetical protein QOM24_18855 [Enterobacter asburiae]
MATNEFKPFSIAGGANIISQAEYEALAALSTGFSSGVAKANEINKVLRQASFIAAALAQYTANKSGLDVLDNGDLNGFITKMTTAFGKDFQALDATLTALAGLATGADKLPFFTGADTASQTDLTSVGRDIIGKSTVADILVYLGLSNVANKNQVYLSNNNLSELAQAGVAAQAAARLNLGGVPTKGEVYLSNNNLSELAAAGSSAQAAARNNLGLGNAALKSEVYLSNNNLSELAAAGSAAQAAARGNLGLGSASTRNIGTGASQVPDMGAFSSSLGSAGALNATGYIRLPGGYIRQWGTSVADANGDVSIIFPVAFSVKPDSVYFGYRQSSVPTAVQSIIINDASSDNTRIVCRAYKIDGSGTITGSTNAFYWTAEGKV